MIFGRLLPLQICEPKCPPKVCPSLIRWSLHFCTFRTCFCLNKCKKVKKNKTGLDKCIKAHSNREDFWSFCPYTSTLNFYKLLPKRPKVHSCLNGRHKKTALRLNYGRIKFFDIYYNADAFNMLHWKPLPLWYKSELAK